MKLRNYSASPKTKRLTIMYYFTGGEVMLQLSSRCGSVSPVSEMSATDDRLVIDVEDSVFSDQEYSSPDNLR